MRTQEDSIKITGSMTLQDETVPFRATLQFTARHILRRRHILPSSQKVPLCPHNRLRSHQGGRAANQQRPSGETVKFE